MLVLGLVVFMTYCTYAPNIYRASEGISWKFFFGYISTRCINYNWELLLTNRVNARKVTFDAATNKLTG